jgi:hypothetical protein
LIPVALIEKLAPYRLILTTMAVAALCAFCLYVGYKWGSRALPEAVVIQQGKVIEIQGKRGEVTAEKTVEYVDRIVTVREEGRVIVQEVTKYVPSDCALPDSVRVFHNAAASGSFPEGARAGNEAGEAAKNAAW